MFYETAAESRLVSLGHKGKTCLLLRPTFPELGIYALERGLHLPLKTHSADGLNNPALSTP